MSVTTMMNNSEKPKFFGRRKGRVIHKAKSFLLDNFLPCILLSAEPKADLAECFGGVKKKYCLEIGFGDGDHLAALAKREPNCGFIGVEVYRNGVAQLLSLLTGLKEGNSDDLAQEIKLADGRADNVRVFDDDVRLLFAALPDESFDKIYLLFPDPWPKNRHAERRFINPDNLKEMARLLKKGGILQVATDHPVYKRWTLETMRNNTDFKWTAKTSDDWRNPPADWAETKYQRKAVREGRRPVFFEFERL
ncbi:MAG: tRNA (guanosine(46)-N7)-methyltransferase TrmB [Alphaproteobacteria bacterium]|nr:tRNA (guanosine(46)-N7)-methyltransferase TrmB [Alphaproteobacteria bacterium]